MNLHDQLVGKTYDGVCCLVGRSLTDADPVGAVCVGYTHLAVFDNKDIIAAVLAVIAEGTGSIEGEGINQSSVLIDLYDTAYLFVFMLDKEGEEAE